MSEKKHTPTPMSARATSHIWTYLMETCAIPLRESQAREIEAIIDRETSASEMYKELEIIAEWLDSVVNDSLSGADPLEAAEERLEALHDVLRKARGEEPKRK